VARSIEWLCLAARLVPVDDINQLPGILAELPLKLALFVDNQLGSGEKHAGALVLVGVIYVEFARGQVIGRARTGFHGLTDPDRAVGGEADPAAGGCTSQPNISEVGADCAGDGNAANRLRLAERVHQTLALALLERVDEDLPVFRRGELVDDHLNAEHLAQLGAGAHCGCVNRR
jgi:hypothetical protein